MQVTKIQEAQEREIVVKCHKYLIEIKILTASATTLSMVLLGLRKESHVRTTAGSTCPHAIPSVAHHGEQYVVKIIDDHYILSILEVHA